LTDSEKKRLRLLISWNRYKRLGWAVKEADLEVDLHQLSGVDIHTITVQNRRNTVADLSIVFPETQKFDKETEIGIVSEGIKLMGQDEDLRHHPTPARVPVIVLSQEVEVGAEAETDRRKR